MHFGAWSSREIYRFHAVAARRLARTFSDSETVRDLLNFATALDAAAEGRVQRKANCRC